MDKEQIMVVEDEAVVALSIQNKLEKSGFEVPVVVASGEEAIREAEEISLDLVLMDIKLDGEMDGVEAAKIIRERFNIPVVYLTGQSDKNTLQRAKITEPFGYILKPFEDKELLTSIEMALYKHKMERKLKEERNRAEFFRDLLAHDINNFNHGIFSYLQMILEAIEFSGKIKSQMEKCLHLSGKITGLITKVRLLSEIGKEAIYLENVDFKSTLLKNIETIKVGDNKKDVHIKHDFSKEEDVFVRGNQLLETIILNILNNAVKHNCRKDVEIEISHRLSNDVKYWRFEFKDNGTGIEGRDKERIFDRLERAVKDKGVHGFGLGLTLVKKIVEGFGGKIWVEDRVKSDFSEGCNFVVLIPSAKLTS